jgi:formate dehydrogenase maturation protein FdhE
MGRDDYGKALKKLEELERTSPPDSIALYMRLTRLQLEARADIEIKEAHPSQEEIHERMGLGVPALKFAELQLDWARVENLFRRALSVISEYSPAIDQAGAIQLRPIVESWYNKQSFPHDGMDEDILTVAVHTALKPFLSKWSERLLPGIRREQWRRGYCLVCGGTPNFSYLDCEQGARWLCCPRCDAEWLFQRLECPFCGNGEQKELAFFTDDDGRYRVYICKRCEGYLKAIDLRKGNKNIIMSLEWIKTLDLDRQACEKGYKARTQTETIDDRGDF